MNRTATRAALVALPLAAFALYAAFNWFRLEDEAVTIGAQPEAIEDPYLAYGRLLERMGSPVRRLDAPSRLESLPAGGSLLIAGRRLAYMTPERVRRIVAWVERGGNLILEWERPGIDDPLLEAFGISRVFPKEAPRPPGARDVRDAVTSSVLTFDWPHLGGPVRARAGTRVGSLVDERNRTDVHVVRQGDRLVGFAVPVGQGRVTALPSLRFLRNDLLGELDHAELGWRLVSGAGSVLLYLQLQSAGLADWLQNEAWPAVVAAALLLLLWLARIVPRFGPLEPDAPPARRSLLEHIVASGRFLWSRDAAAELLAAVQERAARATRRKGASTQPLAAQVPGAAAARMDADAFTQRIASLQQLEQGAAPKEKRKKKGRSR